MNCKNDMSFIIPLKMDPNAYEDYASAFDEKIDVCKEQADPERYFGLFAKHLKKFPDGGLGKKIALVDISNLAVDKMIIDLNPKAEYVLVDNFLDFKLLKALAPEASISLICTDDGSILEQFEELQKLNISMKFDVVVGNPPYDGSLHLKILKKTMEFINFENDGEIIWLAPIHWLQDPLATYKKTSDYKKYKKSIFKKIIDIDVISSLSINKLFGIHFQNDLGVLRLGINDTDYDLSNMNKSSSVTEKVMTYIESNEMNSIRSHVKFMRGNDPLPPYFNYVLDLYGGAGIYGSLFIKSFGYQKPKSPTTKDVSKSLNGIVEFQSEAEAVNFGNAAKTKFFKFLMLMHISGLHFYFGKYFPYMQDYTQPWTDERFYKYFNLTDDEIKLIEETIKE